MITGHRLLCRSPGLLPGDGASRRILLGGRTARLDARGRERESTRPVFVTAAAPSKTNQTESPPGSSRSRRARARLRRWTLCSQGRGPRTWPPALHTVAALPQFGYVLNGTTSWSLNVKAWVPFTLTAGGYVFQYGTPAGYTAPSPRWLTTWRTRSTWTQQVGGAANPTYYSYFTERCRTPLGSFDVAPIELGDKNLANGELEVKVSATLSEPGRAGEQVSPGSTRAPCSNNPLRT